MVNFTKIVIIIIVIINLDIIVNNLFFPFFEQKYDLFTNYYFYLYSCTNFTFINFKVILKQIIFKNFIINLILFRVYN